MVSCRTVERQSTQALYSWIGSVLSYRFQKSGELGMLWTILQWNFNSVHFELIGRRVIDWTSDTLSLFDFLGINTTLLSLSLGENCGIRDAVESKQFSNS
jgi:hypothetical protein